MIGEPEDLERAMGKRTFAICYFCGKKAEYTACSNEGVPSEDARCEVLKGWLTVAHWKGMHSVDHYDFCSFSCLQKWVESQIPKVPEVFLKAFEKESL